MSTRTFFIGIVVCLFMLVQYACSSDKVKEQIDSQLFNRLVSLSPEKDIRYFILPDSKDLSAIPQGRGNVLTPEKVSLGQQLFFETGLGEDAKHSSGRGTFSCATCHVPSSGFMPGRMQGVADGGMGFGLKGEGRITQQNYVPGEFDVQGARPLALLNIAFVTNTTWSGKFGAHHNNANTKSVWDNEPATQLNHMGMDGLETQNIDGLKVHRMRIDEPTMKKLGYIAMFDSAFADIPKNQRYTPLTGSLALSAYIRSITTTEAPFQRWLRGDETAMSTQEKQGAMLFFNKAGCYRCHKGAALNANEFYALGVSDLYEVPGTLQTDANDKRNFGRGGFTGRQEDLYKFKVPQLYNLHDSPFYFHGSSRHSLFSVVEYFNKALPENARVPKANIAREFHPLQLDVMEMQALTLFLEKSLRDPNLERYAPASVKSGSCFPNNDPLSKQQMNCD